MSVLWLMRRIIIRVPKVPFRFFDKLKYEVRNKVLIFVSVLKLRQKTSKIRVPKV